MPAAVLLMGMGRGGGVSLPDLAVIDSQIDPDTANAILTLNSDGSYTAAGVGSGTWLSGGLTNGSAYDVRATLNSGALTSGTTGSWLQMSSNRVWRVGQIGVGSGSANVTFEFRLTGGGSNLDTATVTFSAEVTA